MTPTPQPGAAEQQAELNRFSYRTDACLQRALSFAREQDAQFAVLKYDADKLPAKEAEITNLIGELAALTRQRDELLTALKIFVDHFCEPGACAHRNDARALVANARGTGVR